MDVHKCITWLKKFSEGKKAWEKAYVDYGLSPYKLNTFVNTRYVEIFHPFVFFHMLDFFLSFFVFGFVTYLNYLFVTHISSNLLLFQPRKKYFHFQCINLNLDLKYVLDYSFISTKAFHFSHDVRQGQRWKNSKKENVLQTNVLV